MHLRLPNSVLFKAISLQSLQETCIETYRYDFSVPVGGSQALGN